MLLEEAPEDSDAPEDPTPMAEVEEWRAVVGWEGLYEVSSLGRVRSLPRQTSHGIVGGRVLKPSPNKRRNNYLQVGLSNVTRRTAKVHVLVAAAFHGERPDGMEIRHLDGDPANNAASNLRYGTKSENMLDAVRHGTHRHASRTECLKGHPLETGARQRFCRQCNNESHRKSYLRGRDELLSTRKARRAEASRIAFAEAPI